MKKELGQAKRKEIEKYLLVLKQEDQKYDLESTNYNKLEHEILKLYKRWSCTVMKSLTVWTYLKEWQTILIYNEWMTYTL